MSISLHKISLLLVFVCSTLFAQLKHETRAVWVATNFGLDWPHGLTTPEQKRDGLREIFRNIAAKNYNTVYFQVRSNGQTLYNSKYESYSSVFVRHGNTPPFDPAEYAIELAREYGLEIHAWVNVLRCFSGSNRVILNDPSHPVNVFGSKAVMFYENNVTSYWLDPGFPEVREYLVNLFTDLLEKYNFDGLHLDFIRYPGKSFRDENTYKLYGNNQPISQFRRNNITLFMTALRKNIRNVNPKIKIGAAPIGIYKNGTTHTGLQAYWDVSQDVETWVADDLLDYVAPQIYWNISDKPKFDVIADEWKIIIGNKLMIPGIAAYKQDVKSEMNQIIDYCRKINTDGMAFFRYGNIKNNMYFNNFALPAKTNKIEIPLVAPPLSLSSSISANGNKTILRWVKPSGEFSPRYYAVYEIISGTNKFAGLVPGDLNSKTIFNPVERKLNYSYSVSSIDEEWSESKNRVTTTISDNNLAKLVASTREKYNPVLVNKKNHFVLLVNSTVNDKVELKGIYKTGSKTLLSRKLNKGLNIFKLSSQTAKYTHLEIYYISSGKKQSLRI